MSFVKMVNESVDLEEAKEFLKNTEVAFRKQFPNGYFYADAGIQFGHAGMTIRLGLIEDQKDCPNNIRQNDPMYHVFSVYSNTTDLKNDKLEFSSLQSGISVKPEPGSYMAMGRVKTKPRALKGDISKIEKALDKFYVTLRKLFDENKENIYGVEKYDTKYLK